MEPVCDLWRYLVLDLWRYSVRMTRALRAARSHQPIGNRETL